MFISFEALYNCTISGQLNLHTELLKFKMTNTFIGGKMNYLFHVTSYSHNNMCLTIILKGHRIKLQVLCKSFALTMIHKKLRFSSPEHKVLKVSFCDGPLSVVHRPSVRPCVRPSTISTTSSLKPLIGFWPNFTGMIPGWSPIKVVQTVPVGCISRSRGQTIGFQNAIFKNLLVQNYGAQSFHGSQKSLSICNYTP